MQKKIVRITTVPEALRVLLRGQLKFMSAHFEVIGVAADEPLLAKVKEEQQIRTEGINMTRKITPFADLKSIWSLYKFFKKEKPVIVHTHTPKAGLVGMIAARMAGVPVRMHTVAGLPLMVASGVKRTVLEIVEKVTYTFATKVYPNSFKQAEFIVENKFTSSSKIKVIGNGSSNGIDTTYFDPQLIAEESKAALKKQMQLTSTDIVLCFVGRIVSDKGIAELVASFVEINKQNSNVKLVLVGPFESHLDPLDVETMQQIKQHPCIKWIDFQDDVRPYLAITDVFVFPSYREGFPNVVMQAGAMNLPCIVTDINGCNEIIEQGKNGLIIPAQDKVNLKKAIERLVYDRALRKNLQSNAREMIVTRYEQKLVWNLILQEYKEMLTAHNVN